MVAALIAGWTTRGAFCSKKSVRKALADKALLQSAGRQGSA